MDSKISGLIVLGIVLVLLAVGAFAFWGNKEEKGERSPGELDVLAACLTGKGYNMAGAEWCSACKKQKEVFGVSFDLIDYRDCGADSSYCAENKLEACPTLIDPIGEKIVGVQSAEELLELAECEI